MSARSALKRIFRPFGSAVMNRRWANFADVGFAGVIVCAGGAFIGAATVAHGRAQTAWVVVGVIFVVIAVVLAVIARWIGTREPSGKPDQGNEGNGSGGGDDLAEALRKAHQANDELEDYLYGNQPDAGEQGQRT